MISKCPLAVLSNGGSSVGLGVLLACNISASPGNLFPSRVLHSCGLGASSKVQMPVVLAHQEGVLPNVSRCGLLAQLPTRTLPHDQTGQRMLPNMPHCVAGPIEDLGHTSNVELCVEIRLHLLAKRSIWGCHDAIVLQIRTAALHSTWIHPESQIPHLQDCTPPPRWKY